MIFSYCEEEDELKICLFKTQELASTSSDAISIWSINLNVLPFLVFLIHYLMEFEQSAASFLILGTLLYDTKIVLYGTHYHTCDWDSKAVGITLLREG